MVRPTGPGAGTGAGFGGTGAGAGGTTGGAGRGTVVSPAWQEEKKISKASMLQLSQPTGLHGSQSLNSPTIFLAMYLGSIARTPCLMKHLIVLRAPTRVSGVIIFVAHPRIAENSDSDVTLATACPPRTWARSNTHLPLCLCATTGRSPLMGRRTVTRPFHFGVMWML